MIHRTTIKAYQVGLVFENGKLNTVLEEGKHWVLGTKEVQVFEMKQSFVAPVEITLLLQNEKLASMLEVVEITDGEIAFYFVNGIFKEVLATGRYAFWKGYMENTFIKANIQKVAITEAIPVTILENMKVRSFIRKFIVASNDTGLLFVNGEFLNELKAGTHYFWNNTITIDVKTVDRRQQQLEIGGQELLTKDKAGLRINFFVSYKVVNIMKAVVENKEYEKQLYVAMQLALRAFVSTFTLDELLAKKETIGETILEETKTAMTHLGLSVVAAGIKDIILPGDMKEIMNQVLVAEKKAQANSIMRREETAATRSLLNTAKLMEENEMLWKLKEMEYVEKITEKIGEITISGSGNIMGQLKEIFVK